MLQVLPDGPLLCTTRELTPFATACDCFPTRIPTIPTTTSASSTFRTRVDFICGDGDVWFERCRLVTEKRTLDGSGRNVITAPKTSKTQWGYIFNHCTVENIVSNFEYARGWSGTPHSIWLHTTLLTPERLNPTRFDSHGMRTIQNDFKEYGTIDAQGRDITPRSNVVTFTLKDEKNPVETILTADEAKRYTVKRVFLDWNPQKVIRQTEKKAKTGRWYVGCLPCPNG